MNVRRRVPRSAAALVLFLALALSACGSEARTADATLHVGGTDVFAIDREPVSSGDQPTILFLHGASFNADIWVDTGILDAVAASGRRAVAVDLPGYGETPSTDTSPGEFLAALIDEVDDGSGVVVVSPSMSGSFSLALLHDDPSAMSGFVPVAPVGISDVVASTDPIADLPTLVVWGENDDVIDPALAGDLMGLLSDSEMVTIPDAGHAAYKDQPTVFIDELLRFLDDTFG